MDSSKRKLRSGKEKSGQRPENKDEQVLPDCSGAVDDGKNEGTLIQCERTHTASEASSKENNSCVCCECDFVAKTPTALKIHCRRKHNNLRAEVMGTPAADEARQAESVAEEMPTTAPPTDQLSNNTPPTDQLSTDEPPVDQLSPDQPPIDHLSNDELPIDQLSTDAPPIQHLSTPAQHFERLYCRCCCFYTWTAEEMNAHLSNESHQDMAMKKSIGPLFEQCVEKVLVILAGEQKHKDDQSEHDKGVNEGVSEDEHTEVVGASTTPKRKRGRPKSSQVISCSHCGLVASNPTNLSVHIRRKHSLLYSFQCKLCKYSCVTKGDMDRHCETKKHIKRMQSDGDGQEAVIVLNAEQAAQSGEAGPAKKTHNASNASQDKPKVEEEGETEGTEGDIPSKKAKYDSVYSCNHCYFVAHSALSLALHVRRKHTRDFEFMCLACSYYAVTRREMSRHTATEKHKLKCQRYLQKRYNTDQHDKDVNKQSENTNQLPESADQQSDNADKTIENAHQNTDNARQHTETGDNKQQNTKPLHQNTDPEPDTGDNDDPNSNAGNDAAAEKVSAGEEELNMKPQLRSSEDTNGSKDSLEFPDSSKPEIGEEECNNDDADDNEEGEEDNDDEDEEYVCETTAENPSSVFRAAAFDECVISLKVPADVLCDKGDGEPYKSVHQAAKMLKMSEGHEVSTRVRCDDCGFLAEGLSGLNVHITMKHSSKEKNFHCLLCGKSFHSDSSLQQHLSSSAHLRTERGSMDERPDGGAAFRCVRCNEPCNSEQELFVHIKEKHEELLREVNKYVIEDTEQINREREENPGNVCKYCGKVCKSSNSMAFLAHVRTHTGTHLTLNAYPSWVTGKLEPIHADFKCKTRVHLV